jgi:hypothetical protein
MIELVVTLTDTPHRDPADRVHVYSDLDSVGNTSGVLKDQPDTNEPLRMFPGLPIDGLGYLEVPYLSGEYLGPVTEGRCSVRASIGPAHFGRVHVGLAAVDAAGNVQSDPVVVSELTVNSPPMPVVNLRLGDYVDGSQWFTYQASPQLEAL